MDMKTCSKCLLEKSVEDFNISTRNKDGYRSDCKICRATINAERFKNRDDAWIKQHNLERSERRTKTKRRNYIKAYYYFQEHPCVDCGNTNFIVLEFDHISDVKNFEVGWAIKQGDKSWEKILPEIDLCEVRCRNCHRRKTAERANQVKWRLQNG